ncbi:MAG: DNA-binding transcriptional regulator OxyR [Candidatus Melainabacteria bacterium HGW-Melainabacteria-1]|nr:MAG: DNA-binding transcriptional regulator OxyR [Candidatus Melainabacteria bacterium HGW-Melainabacteria-1]
MNLRDLEYLVALDAHRHFHRAADACFVSQPTLSGQLKKLELHLGVQLVERGRRQRVLLTPTGQLIVARAQRILQDAREIEQLAKLAQNPFHGPLRLALIPTLAPYLLPRIVQPLKQRWPELELLLHEVQTAPMLHQLAAGELELGILALPVAADGLVTQALFEESFYLAVYPGHPLASQPQIQVADLHNETMLLLDDGHCFREQALEICFSAGAHEKNSFRGTSLETLRQMVLARSGLTLLPELAIDDKGDVVCIPFAAPQPTRSIGLVWRQGSPRENVFRAMGEIIQNTQSVSPL